MNNENFVLPKVYWIGETMMRKDEMNRYLKDTDQEEFLVDIIWAKRDGLSDGEQLCSFYAKLCYASLTTKKNKNISKIRSIVDNLINIVDTGHGSVLEHCSLNFVVTDCSRILTHELVRHRVGTAFSQTSGRYVRNDVLKLVLDPILEPAYGVIEDLRVTIESAYKALETVMLNGVTDFTKKKKITSALRRILPNGQANEIGVTLNLRTLRHTIEARTSRHAEWEIIVVFNQIAELIRQSYTTMFFDSETQLVENLNEITFKNKKI